MHTKQFSKTGSKSSDMKRYALVITSINTVNIFMLPTHYKM
jgi:hypothetical protein